MENAKRKPNTSSAISTVLVILLILELIAAALLSARLVRSGDRSGLRISLTETAGETPGAAFTVRDEDKIWQTETEVEIFHLRYDAADGSGYSVVSGDGQKVLAPGTDSEYRFTLSNEVSVPLDFTMRFACWMEGEKDFLPVEVKLLDGAGKYFLGSSESWDDVKTLDGACDEGVLEGGTSKDYIFAWRWPFERSDGENGTAPFDAEDTALGNAAVEKDISLHIRIMTHAEYDGDISESGGEKSAADGSGGRAWALVNLICTILSVAIGGYETAIFLRGRGENETAKQQAVFDSKAYSGRMKRRRQKIFDLIPALGAVVVFILTEDMRLPMTLVDRWTPVMVLILSASVTVGLLTKIRRWDKTLDEARGELEEAAAAK